MKRLQAYVRNVGAGISHLFNALTGGDARVSFSARVGAAEHRGRKWARVVASIIDGLLFSHNHCEEQAREAELI